MTDPFADADTDADRAALVTISLPTLEAGAEQLDRLAAGIPWARSFLLRHSEVRRYYTSELFRQTLTLHDAVVPHIAAALDEIGATTADAAARLHATRDAYARATLTDPVDSVAVEALWSCSGDDQNAGAARTSRSGADQPPTALTDTLGTQPRMPHPMPDLFDGALDLAEYIDSAPVGRHSTRVVFGKDPVADIATKTLGDWADIAAAGTTLARIAEFCDHYACALTERVAALRQGWGDTTSRRCLTVLVALVEKVRRLAGTMRELGQGYQRLATTIWEANTTVADGITTILDRYLVPVTEPSTAEAVQAWRIVSRSFATAYEEAGRLVDQLGAASFRLSAAAPSRMLEPAR